MAEGVYSCREAPFGGLDRRIFELLAGLLCECTMDQRRLGVADGIADDGVSISHGQVAVLPKCLATAKVRVQHAVGNTFISCEIKDVGFWHL